MRGIILCGGMGTRLHPLTVVTNKHLLPVYDRPMIYWAIQSMVSSSIKDILLVCGGNAAGEFLRLVGNGAQFGLKHVAYTYQHEPKGIADALGLCEEWACGEPICVLLGDNVIEKPFTQYVRQFEEDPQGARIFLTTVLHPERYGVVQTDLRGNVLEIVEKPKQPKTNLIAIGLYMYDSTVWEYIRSLVPSARNELEITDLNNRYLKMGQLKAHQLEGYWADCGESIQGYMESCIAIYNREPYFTPVRVKEQDAKAVAAVEHDGEFLRAGVKRLREGVREFCQKCTPDQSYCAYPHVLDVKHDGIMVVPARCDDGEQRYVEVRCNLYNYSPDKVRYIVRVNGSRYITSTKGTYEDVLDIITTVIYKKNG